MNKILQEIEDERSKQDAKWGGPSHDDTHTVYEWGLFIHQQIQRYDKERSNFRSSMVRIAALAVAAIESYDRLKDK